METRQSWQATNPTLLDSYNGLGPREQKAVWMALHGIVSWHDSAKEPAPMRVRISPENPFDLKGFANVLHEMRIGIGESLAQENGVVTFQPRPYDRTFMPQTREDLLYTASEWLRQTLAEVPGDFREFINRLRSISPH
ncbi:hypothetical protein M1563_01580 [Patescibacteria group bacterium]|nr:hypothetical protein [Patescibacteria group bacterium]MCL5409976.1 hypothetical protein [Patescibacteria group bacterium]